MIQARAYDDLAAAAVFRRLDVNDHVEAEVIRGAEASHLALWADWRGVQGACAGSFVFLTTPNRGARPFAVAQLVSSGQAGVALGAFMASDHFRNRRAIAEALVLIRTGLPDFCRKLGIHRVETRCWAGHPTASLLLEQLGFTHETDMPGFGPDGRHVFRQFARTFPPIEQQRS